MLMEEPLQGTAFVQLLRGSAGNFVADKKTKTIMGLTDIANFSEDVWGQLWNCVKLMRYLGKE